MADETNNAAFTMTTETVYLNLHRSAQEKAASKMGITPGRTINQYILNTICSEGSEIQDEFPKDPKFDEPGKVNEMEMAIVMEPKGLVNLQDQSLLDDERKLKLQRDENKKILDGAKKLILDGINEYFQWFSGDKSAFMETDLVLYIPKYNGGKAEVSVNGNSRSLVPVNDQDEYMALFDPSSSGHPSKEQVEKLVKELGETPKIGYKVSYSIS